MSKDDLKQKFYNNSRDNIPGVFSQVDPFELTETEYIQYIKLAFRTCGKENIPKIFEQIDSSKINNFSYYHICNKSILGCDIKDIDSIFKNINAENIDDKDRYIYLIDESILRASNESRSKIPEIFEVVDSSVLESGDYLKLYEDLSNSVVDEQRYKLFGTLDSSFLDEESYIKELKNIMKIDGGQNTFTILNNLDMNSLDRQEYLTLIDESLDIGKGKNIPVIIASLDVEKITKSEYLDFLNKAYINCDSEEIHLLLNATNQDILSTEEFNNCVKKAVSKMSPSNADSIADTLIVSDKLSGTILNESILICSEKTNSPQFFVEILNDENLDLSQEDYLTSINNCIKGCRPDDICDLVENLNKNIKTDYIKDAYPEIINKCIKESKQKYIPYVIRTMDKDLLNSDDYADVIRMAISKSKSNNLDKLLEYVDESKLSSEDFIDIVNKGMDRSTDHHKYFFATTVIPKIESKLDDGLEDFHRDFIKRAYTESNSEFHNELTASLSKEGIKVATEENISGFDKNDINPELLPDESKFDKIKNSFRDLFDKINDIKKDDSIDL